jgi:hypothetical protein
VATVTLPPSLGANLPKIRSADFVIAMGTITVALELLEAALAAKLGGLQLQARRPKPAQQNEKIC